MAPLCLHWEGSCAIPRTHFCLFSNSKSAYFDFLDVSAWLLCVCLGRAHAPFPELTFVCFRIRKVHILNFWMCFRGSSLCALGRLMRLLCVCLGRAHAPVPEFTFVSFLIRKMHILIFWMCLRGSSVCARGRLMRLLCVCIGRAHAPFPELTFVCFLIRKVHISNFWMCLRGSSVCSLGGLMHPFAAFTFFLFELETCIC